ncbi:serine hydrolase domain-containing protein [uncultured Sphingomonas sp.]|uniref:serine hydrolase domain-containing protein n=1 Tax=uncultured Sphingomonas sp. TaxID=158754 RepID=UPI0025D6A2D1|nr:serine hydrolase domain-containing protein [uncultured Sphingomonas sp.]
MRMIPTLLFLGALVAGPATAQARDCPIRDEASGGPVDARVRRIMANLRLPVQVPGERASTLGERMRAYGVPGVSVAVIHRGRIAWARGWGVRDAATCAPVTPDTMFQAASISKVVTAMLALRLVEQGKIALDNDINTALRSWHLPPDAKLAPRGVTLRQLLSHTAGLGVHGFAGYATGAPLPSTVQILEGSSPANSEAVRSTLPAGGQWRYSGGGYVVTQLALSDVSGLSFARLADRDILRPLRMAHSTFSLTSAPTIHSDLAFGHANGQPIAGNYHVYPELGPAGLWTTARDLARLLIDVQASAQGRPGHRLSPAMTATMLTPVRGNWGLGPMLYTDGARRFGHDGVNEGYQSSMVAYADRGDGIAILTNGGQGRRLMDEIVRAVATEYGWSEIAAPAATEQQLSAAALSKRAGRFDGGDLSVTFEARKDGLYAHTGGPAPERLIALPGDRFFTAGMGIVIRFAPDADHFDIIEGGPPIRFERQPTSENTEGPKPG